MQYISEMRMQITYDLPLAEIVLDFFDQLKSRSRGYASLTTTSVACKRPNSCGSTSCLAANVDALSMVCTRTTAYAAGRVITERLKARIPRQQFDVPIQAAIGANIVARETVKAVRKDVTAGCYGGDISRKRKLLENQKKGKKKMKQVGRVEVPQEAFLAVLQLDSDTPA